MLELARAADPTGRFVLVDDGDYRVLDPERYDLVFSAFAFDNIPGAEHRAEILGEQVRIVMKDVEDRRPVIDIVWFHEDYLAMFAAADLELVAHHLPLGRDDEPYDWISETSIAPWSVYILRPRE